MMSNVCWAICIYSSNDDLLIGKMYDIYDENGTSYLVALESKKKEYINKKWFIPDTDKEFANALTIASFLGSLELD